jgi:hypothetical protein
MASFLDAVVDDPSIEISTHDWNSIMQLGLGRIEDGRRTCRRMVFLYLSQIIRCASHLSTGISAEKYFNVLILWTEVEEEGGWFLPRVY